MRVWVVCFIVFFSAAELYQWVQQITLPLPVLVIIGAILAIASNIDKFSNRGTMHRSLETVTSSYPASDLPPSNSTQAGHSAQAAIPSTSTPAIADASAPSRYYPGAQLPDFTAQSRRSISFPIRPPLPSVPPMTDQPDSREP